VQMEPTGTGLDGGRGSVGIEVVWNWGYGYCRGYRFRRWLWGGREELQLAKVLGLVLVGVWSW
jgi:hypothetical protein